MNEIMTENEAVCESNVIVERVDIRRNYLRMSISELLFKTTVILSPLISFGIVAAIFLTLLVSSIPTIQKFGFHFLISTDWDPVAGQFGALTFIIGTLLSTMIAVLISVPFSISIALLLGEYYSRSFVAIVIRRIIDIMAGIPSVIYGFWALFFLVPAVRQLEMALGVPPYGIGIFTSGLILSIMIIPYSSSLAIEVIKMVPSDLKNGAYALSATRFEVIKAVVIPYASSGIIAGIILALGRALGETMAVTMVIGNANTLPDSIFSPGNTMASLIANEFTEASRGIHLTALIEIGLILMIISALLNFAGRELIHHLAPGAKR